MNLRKVFIVPLVALALTGCKEYSYVGDYGFQLGKDSGAHISINMALTDEAFSDPTLGKEFSLSIDLGSVLDDLVSEEALEDIEEFIEGNGVIDINGNVVTAHGFYTIGDKDNSGNAKLNIGVALFEQEAEEGSDLPSSLEIPPEMVDDIMYATVSKSNVTLNIPISMDDLINQLYWYGFDFNKETFEFDIVDAHPHGTHPTADDITYINDTLGYKTSHGGVAYRDFHLLSMSLAKK